MTDMDNISSNALIISTCQRQPKVADTGFALPASTHTRVHSGLEVKRLLVVTSSNPRV